METRRAARLLAAAVLPAAALALAACGGGAQASDVARARRLYETRCAVCHGSDGAGRQTGGMRTQSLKGDAAMSLTEEQLRQRIERGSSNMPSFRTVLTEEQTRDLARFVRAEIQGR